MLYRATKGGNNEIPLLECKEMWSKGSGINGDLVAKSNHPVLVRSLKSIGFTFLSGLGVRGE